MKKQKFFSLFFPSWSSCLRGAVLLLLFLFLTGCDVSPDYIIARARERFFPRPTLTAMPPPLTLETPTLAQKVVDLSTPTPARLRITRLPTLTLTATATATPVPTGTPTPAWVEADGSAPVLAVQSELPALDPAGTVALHGVILFKTRAHYPLRFPEASEAQPLPAAITRVGQQGDISLWAVSIDGASAGRLNPDGRSTDLRISEEGRAVVVENGFTLIHPLVDLLALPEQCAGEAAPCDQVQLSADGFVLGARYGPDECGRGLLLINQLSGDPILDYNFGVHSFSFLPYGRSEFTAGSGENGIVTFVDPYTGAFTPAGEQGLRIWNTAHTLFVEEARYCGGGASVWAYRPSDGVVFTPFSQGSESSVLFMQDEKRFLFESLSYPSAGQSSDIKPSPMRIMRFDPGANELVQLAADPGYHYRFCQRDPLAPCPLAWYGDWIQIQRVPFAEPSQPPDLSAQLEDLFPCLYGREPCPGAENMALNAYTGEVIPFDPSQLPQMAVPTPTATPGPRLAGKAVYADPGGRFAFYAGLDGHSLWLAPAGEPPVLWVAEGEEFIYLP